MPNGPDNSVHQRFSSRLGVLLSCVGIAVGTGNIWRFPRIAAKSGGEEGAGAFLVAWVLFLFLWSIPLMIGEYAIGRKTRLGVIGSFIRMAGKPFAWMGTFVVFVACAITFFYSVVLGWCVYYFCYTMSHSLPTSFETARQVWDSYQQSPWPLLTHAIVMGLGAWAIWRGVTSIERVNKVLIPVLLVILLGCFVRALTLSGAGEGLTYLFTPQWSQLGSPSTWMEALTQNAWDTGAGWGLFLTYATYMKRSQGAARNAFMTGIANNTISLIAAMTVFGIVFSVLGAHLDKGQVLEVMRDSGEAGTGLTFMWMPQLFERMLLGRPLAILFFLALTFAGFSSLIAQIELPTRVLVDAGFKRSYAIVAIVGGSYVLGIPSAINLKILANQDFVWGLALMISGAFMAFLLIKHGPKKLRTEEITRDPNEMRLGRWWDIVIQYFVPIAAVTLVAWWLYMSATVDNPEQWYNPFAKDSVMTCFFQWFVAFGIFLGLNKLINRRMESRAA